MTTFFLAISVGIWILDRDAPAWARIVSTPVLVVTVAACIALSTRRLSFGSRGRREAPLGRLPRVWTIVGGTGAAVLGVVILVAGNDGLWPIPPAVMASIIATYLPPPHRRALIGVAALLAAALGWVMSDDGLLRAMAYPPIMVGSFAWVTLGLLWAWDLAERLTEARRLAAELAVKDERLRFAADLHDIQGHHLQVIALKSELAARLAESDPDRATAEMKEVQRLATDALEDTRAVVRGYRRTTMEAEISNAAKVLEAADIDTTMNVEPAVSDLPATSRHLLGLVVREATTNVLRHSRARRAEVDCAIAGGSVRLRVANDGAGVPSPERGTGLDGLADRLTAAGGTLTWTHEDQRFALTASLPVIEGREEQR